MWRFFIAAACVLSTAACSCTPDPDSKTNLEVNSVTACDMLVKQTLVSRKSFDPHTWRFTDMGGEGFVSRPFDATNSFGANISSEYECTFNYRNSAVTMLQIKSPTGGWQRIIGK